ncbi:Peptidoglycan/xylan/chitin deacetylase, PgdA/CDA1 family [Hyunsoonleella jejuensis]|uniref:Peptidoglycan/xylan/chitin deacetylase, PgdA/CDA1 family n=1 Tax=Hyunsoonleella jejuensis TaxID=419940 RepID=A0A1H9AKU9_9FLAO|nr:polysaccharide deacetylase family protein [Hyunsoonleella jejuensis]SEP77350.1 Peptidoglycan/xylan/chitin deacetylase, PgdA/CDA1 family [Hyunsoonleella jejuensis]
MPITPVKTPRVVKSLFPDYTWDIETTEKEIYLTFDDGPTPEITAWTLDVLKQYDAKATFFCIGSNVEKHPGIFKNILKNGHAVGNHTQDHMKGWKTPTETYLKNVGIAQKVFESNIQNSEFRIQNLFRPPYGKITPKQGKRLIALGFNIIMWDVLSFDWDNTVTKDECFTKVISKAKSGSIIVFHDSVKASKNMQYALPKVLEHFNQQGYCFKSLDV